MTFRARENAMSGQEHSVTLRRYQVADYDSVATLWTRILEVFSEAKRNAFWVVESSNQIVGSFGIESRSESDTELRRMSWALPSACSIALKQQRVNADSLK